MVLPLLLSFLAPQVLGAGGALAGLGLSGLSNAALSAIGAGVGGTIESGGDLEKGLLTGLGAFAGGSLLGPMFGGEAGAAASPENLAAAKAAGLPASAAVAPPMRPENLMSTTAAAAPAAGGIGGLGGLKDMFGGFKDYAMSPAGLGTMAGTVAGGAVADKLFGKDDKKKKSARGKSAQSEMQAMPTIPTMPGADYQPGVSGEWNYGIGTPRSAQDIYKYNTGTSLYADGGMLRRMANPSLPGMGPVRLCGGGIVALAEGGETPSKPNEREVISGAIAAVQGRHPQPEIALAQFVQRFGEDALRTLVDKVQSGEMEDTADRFARGENGEVRGPGDGSGVDDMVPAKMDDGSGDVLLSDGEYVLRKDAVDSLEKKFGGGFLDSVNQAGPDAARAAQRHMAAA